MFVRAWKLAGLLALAPLALVPVRAVAGGPPAPADTVATFEMRPDTSAGPRVPVRSEGGAFPVTLGAFATTLAGSVPERTENIRLAAAALDGRVIEPGDVLGFNALVGPRTVERGYQLAPVILHERREVQAGGGICQVASTLFVAALQAGLAPVERWRHSSPVDYIAPGEDATIAWGAKDLRLRNDLDTRVRVRCEIVGATLSARIEAEGPARFTYELETEQRELPADLGVDHAKPGREIELYRVRREGGAETTRELVHRDVFPPSRGARGADR